MNCDDVVFTREEMQQFAKREAERKQIELLNWAMSLCTTGMPPGMIRRQFYNKIVELEGKGERA